MTVRETAVAVVLVSFAAAGPAEAIDQPIDASKLVLKRTATRQTLTFVSRDPDFLFPTAGSADDPATGTPGGLVIDLFSANEGSGGLAAPAGVGKPGWFAEPGQYRFHNGLAPAGISHIRSAVLKQGRVLKVSARVAGIPLAGPQGAVGIRLTMGTRRSCALFGPATIKRDEAGRFIARNALAASMADCSNVSLGGPPEPTTTTSTTSTTLPGCQPIPDPFEPMCGGACPVDEQCAGNFNGGLGFDCTCIPDDAVACSGSGYPTCGGACGAGRVCQAFHLLPGEGPEITSCACVDPSNTCDDPPGTCFEVGVCPPGQACVGQGPPTSACGCGPP